MDSNYILLTPERRKAVQESLLEGKTYNWILTNIHGVSTRDISLVRKEIEGTMSSRSDNNKGLDENISLQRLTPRMLGVGLSSDQDELSKLDSDIYRSLGTFDSSDVIEWKRKLLKLVLPLTIRYNTTDPEQIFQKFREELRREGMKSCEETNHETIAKEAMTKVASEDVAKNRRMFERRAFERAVRYLQQGGKVPVLSLLRSLFKTPEAIQWLSSDDGSIFLTQLGYIPVALADLELRKAHKKAELAQSLLSSELKRPRRSPTDLSIITAETCEPVDTLSNGEKMRLEKLCSNVARQKGWSSEELKPVYSGTINLETT